jgi:hypothetical protein
MSSPTINPNLGAGVDTSLATICNLVRSLINDTQAGLTDTPGEGQIFTNNPAVSPFVQPFLNSSIRALYRELRNVGDPTLIFDNYIIRNITPINGANGPGLPDPALQVYISENGYFDGTVIWPNLLLPSNILTLEKAWERQSNTNNTFVRMRQPQGGMGSRPQQPSLVEWEWRNNQMWMVGSTQTNDLRLRYWGTLPTFYSPTLDFASTYVPIYDCTDALAYKIAVMYSRMLGTPGLPDLISEAKEQMFQLKNAVIKRMQSEDFHRVPYGNYNNSDTNNSYFLNWM